MLVPSLPHLSPFVRIEKEITVGFLDRETLDFPLNAVNLILASLPPPNSRSQEMESYVYKKQVVQALIKSGKAEHLLQLDYLKEERENRVEIVIDEENSVVAENSDTKGEEDE